MAAENEAPRAREETSSEHGVARGIANASPVDDESLATSGAQVEVGFPTARSFVLLRFTLIIATFYLLIAEIGPEGMPISLVLLFGAVLASNLAALRVPRQWTTSGLYTGGVVLFDTLWITLALILSGRFTAEFFYLYFFVLFLAAICENLRLVVLGSVVVCIAYVGAILTSDSADLVLETQFLIRLPFLFAVAIFYGYLVDRLRRERKVAREEAKVIEGLELSRSELERANLSLRSEIRERQRVENALTRANERLQDLTEVRTRFITTVSHEVKTPITSIKNALTVLKKHPDPEIEERFFEIIGRSAERLNLIITDLLDVSRMESGALRLKAEPLDLTEALTTAMEGLNSKAEQTAITPELRIGDSLPTVLADRRRVEQILSDLLRNALQATNPDGSVVLGAHADGGWVELSVEDTGRGLNEVEKRRIFEPFYQTGDLLVDRPPGTGLGLTICRDLARGHGSELKVTSKPGVGSRFSFRVPIDSAQGREIIDFEDDLRAIYRKYPYFGVLVMDLPFIDAAARNATSGVERSQVLEVFRDRLRSLLPRDHARLTPQPAHDRIIVVLLATPRDGCVQVQRRLMDQLDELPVELNGSSVQTPRILGPACFPEDGFYGGRLIEAARAAGTSRSGIDTGHAAGTIGSSA